MVNNFIDATGLTTQTLPEVVSDFTTDFQTIYGPDINLESDTPDGQLLNTVAQAAVDQTDLARQIYNSFDPDQAIGVVLDQRVGINGIQRQAGTFTTTNITVVTSQSLTLPGLDQDALPVYTIADNAGTQWQLIATQSPSGAGTYVYEFEAAQPGAVQTVPNTITVLVTIILGVVSVNNPTTYNTLGINEESDAVLRIRRQQSVALGSQGYYAGLLAALKNIPGVSAAFIYENDTNGTVVLGGNSIPGHSIWVIVAGSAAAADIANAIYTKRNAGCGMFGAISYTVTQVDGSSFVVFWDDVVPETVWIKFVATSLDGVNPPNIALILSQLPIIFKPGVNERLNINDLATLVQEIDPNTLVTGAGFSTTSGGVYTNTILPTTANKQFEIASADIIITPIIASPFNPVTGTPVAVTHSATQQFTPLGGLGPYAWVVLVNNSGSSINGGTGLYTAGSAGFTDTIQVTDSLGNTATALITVV